MTLFILIFSFFLHRSSFVLSISFLKAIASGLEPIALRFEAMPSRLEAIALSFASLRPARPARNDLSVRDPPSDPRTEPRRTEPSLEAMWLGAETPLGALVEDAECEDAPTNPADPEPEKHQLGPSDVLELGTSLSPAPVESPQSEESNAPVLEPEVPILESASIASILRSDTADADAELRADPTEAPLPEAPTLPGERPIGEGGFPEEVPLLDSVDPLDWERPWDHEVPQEVPQEAQPVPPEPKARLNRPVPSSTPPWRRVRNEAWDPAEDSSDEAGRAKFR